LEPVLLAPVATTVIAAVFAVALWRRWRRKRAARYLLWWAVGVTAFGLGASAEAWTSVFGWSEPAFRLWYVAGALLGGWPLAQGTVYLLMRKKTADRLTVVSLLYITVAAAAVIFVPIAAELVEEHRLTGAVMEWGWVRYFSPPLNLYAVIFLAGGAIWSALRYRRRHDRPASHVWGNALIAVGAILPGVGGVFARGGRVEVLYMTELIGLSLIWAGYRMMTGRPVEPLHEAQRRADGAA